MSHTPASRVWLTLLLQGGHRECLSVDADSPLLDKLRETLSGSLAEPCLFEIPIREGAGLMTLHSAQIVAAITEPPLPLTLSSARTAAATTAAAPPVAPSTNSTVAATPLAVAGTGFPEGLSKARAIRVDNVLTDEQHAALLAFASRNRQAYLSSGTSTGARNFRESLVCPSFAPFDALVKQRVKNLLEKASAQLGLETPEGEIEIQLTAHNHGHFYKIHNDNGAEALSDRSLSFVYYFHQTPKPYTGGELRLYDREVSNGILRAAPTYKDVEPLDNSMVLFDSRELHEILPVQCPSLNFADSRFTVNGWVLRKR